jgi:two-component system, chemotaxis family, response regulator Rcp1
LLNREPIEILLVEDNPGDIRLIREALKELVTPTNLHAVRDGMEAVAFLASQGQFADAVRPDLILLDLNLPRKDGREVLKWLKSDPQLRNIPAIVLTSSEADDDIAFCYGHQVNAYLTKPLKIEDYFKLIRALEEFWLTFARLPKG